MRNIILAALLALATATPVIVPAQAASLTITTDDNNRWESNNWHDNGRHNGWRKHHRRHDMSFGDSSRRVYRECEVTTHRYWRNGRLIIERTRDCY
jgi:Ni/Co efflux regulator RcnB